MKLYKKGTKSIDCSSAGGQQLYIGDQTGVNFIRSSTQLQIGWFSIEMHQIQIQSNTVELKSKSSQNQIEIQSNPLKPKIWVWCMSTVVCKIIESLSSFDFYRFFFLTNVIFSFQFYRQSIDSDVLSQDLLRKSSYIT